MATVDDVIKAFVWRDKPHMKSGNVWYNGNALNSYQMVIGVWSEHGTLLVRSHDDSPSVTTSKHIHALAHAARHRTGACTDVPFNELGSYDINYTSTISSTYADGVRVTLFTSRNEPYTLVEVGAKSKAIYSPLFGRVAGNSVPLVYAFKGQHENITLDQLLLRLVPPAYRDALQDGKVRLIGDTLLIAETDVPTNTKASKIQKDVVFTAWPGRTEDETSNAHVYKTAQSFEGLVRGRIESQISYSLTNGEFLVQTTSESRVHYKEAPSFWYRPVPVALEPVRFPSNPGRRYRQNMSVVSQAIAWPKL